MTSHHDRQAGDARSGAAHAAATPRAGLVLAWQRLRWNLRGRGPREVAREVALSTWREIRRGDEFLFLADADAVRAEPAARPGLAVCRCARREDIPAGQVAVLRACIAKPGMPESAIDHYLARLLSPLDEGAEMWLGLCDGAAAGWLWTTSVPEHTEREFPVFPLGERDVVLFAAHTDPPHRGRGLFTLLLRTACSELAREGALRFFARVKTWNGPSAAGMRSAGFMAIGTVRPLALCGRSIAIWTAR
jgi:GNAT superfamily N-acetyltransferase